MGFRFVCGCNGLYQWQILPAELINIRTMRNLLFWGLLPLLAPQALYVRRTAPRFAGAGGPRKGTFGKGRDYRLLAVGDSIIAGVGADHISDALVGRTASTLAELLDASIQWHAMGGIGYRAEKIVEEFLPALPAEPADFIIVSVGVNDITGLTPLPSWRRRLRLLLDRLHAHSPQASVAVAGVPPLGKFPLLPQPLRAVAGLRAASFDECCREVIAEFANAIHVPVSFDFSPGKFAADGYHPSEESYGKFGEEMARGLLRFTEQSRTVFETPRPDRN